LGDPLHGLAGVRLVIVREIDVVDRLVTPRSSTTTYTPFAYAFSTTGVSGADSKGKTTSPLTPCTSMSSTSATCLVTSPEVLKTKSTFGSFFFQSSIAFFAHQFAPPIHPWSAVGMVMPILIFFA